jgi:hypothetical protein
MEMRRRGRSALVGVPGDLRWAGCARRQVCARAQAVKGHPLAGRCAARSPLASSFSKVL